MPASDQHNDYDTYLPQWTMTRDCVEGSAAIKAKKTKYLPKPNPDDISTENDLRFKDYLERANFVGFTSSTLDGMLGMVFRKKTELELQAAIQYIEENTDGGSLTFDQMARAVIGDVMQTGRFGLLADYPQADEGLSVASVRALGLRANILPYNTEAIINWRTEVVGSIKRLSLVVLKEKKSIVSEDGFSVDEEDQYRVLKLVDNAYVQEIYNKNSELVSMNEPRKADGSKWNEIPFVFVGAKNNDEMVDKAPLYDISAVNIAHYRNSADYEESCYMVGQPTPYAAGLTQSWVDTNMKEGVLLGSRRFIALPENGSAGLLQAAPNQMPERGMELKEQQMIKLGARLIQDAGGVETAEAAKIRFAGQNSKLGTVVGNVEAAFIQCFDWVMMFMAGEGENLLEINKDFYDKSIEPQMVIAQIQLLDRAVIAKADLQDNLRSSGMISQDRTNEQIDDEAETANVML